MRIVFYFLKFFNLDYKNFSQRKIKMLKLYAKAALLLTIVAYLTDAKSLLEQKLGKYGFKLIFGEAHEKGILTK